MPALLFANKSGHCPYGHSLAHGMPQKISWMPCICAPAREAGSTGRGLICGQDGDDADDLAGRAEPVKLFETLGDLNYLYQLLGLDGCPVPTYFPFCH